MQYENISGYKFVDLEDLYGLQSSLKKECTALSLLGTILLSAEGANFMLAGAKNKIEEFKVRLKKDERFSDVWFKHSQSNAKPFECLKVRIKPEIITMCVDGIRPLDKPAKSLAPTQLKEFYDTGKDFIILDTRNDFEMDFGKFKNAKCIHIDSFSEFPAALEKMTEEEKQKPIVTYCTGGVRCEKAAPLMEDLGFPDVYQLEGGIINYFEECGGAHWEGDCFVFDNRVAIDSQLNETGREFVSKN